MILLCGHVARVHPMANSAREGMATGQLRSSSGLNDYVILQSSKRTVS